MTADLIQAQLAQLIKLRRRRVDSVVVQWRQAQVQLLERLGEKGACVAQLEHHQQQRMCLRQQRVVNANAYAGEWNIQEQFRVSLDETIKDHRNRLGQIEQKINEAETHLQNVTQRLQLLKRKLQALEVQWEQLSLEERRQRQQKEQRQLDERGLWIGRDEWVDER